MRPIIVLILTISLCACSFGATPANEPTTPIPLTAISPALPSPSPTSQPKSGSLAETGFWLRQANGLAIARHTAYVTSWEGLHLLDLSEPTTPRQLGFYPTPNQSAASVAVVGNRAYIVAIGLHIVDVSDPTALRRLGFYQPPPAPISTPAVAGNIVYLAAWETGLIIVDVSDPAAPREVNRIAAQEARWVTVAGSRAYLVDRSGVRMLDISDPIRLHQLGLYQVNHAQQVVIAPMSDNPAVTLAYVIATGTMYIVDVSEPTRPQELGAYAPAGGVFSLAVNRNLVYMGVGGTIEKQRGLSVVDVSNPAAPRLVGQVVPPPDPWDGGERGQVAFDESGERVTVLVVTDFGRSLFAFPDVQNLVAPVPGGQ